MQYCVKEQCEEVYPNVESKLWVEVFILAGQDSDQSKLGFSSQIEFVANDQIEIQLSFENAIEVSLFGDEEILMVKLWGPFLSASNLSPISEENRVATKAIPP